MEKQLLRIGEMKWQLFRMGYHGFQVDAMVREVLGGALPEEASSEQRHKLISALENHLACRTAGGGKGHI